MRKLIEKLLGPAPEAPARGSVYDARTWQLRRLAFLKAAQHDAPMDLHRTALLDGLQVAGQPFRPLYEAAMAETGTTVAHWKQLNRILRAFQLARYAELTQHIPGGHAECGVLRGFSALLVARTLRLLRPGYDGSGLFLIDSFEGLSAMHPADAVQGPVNAAGEDARPFFMEAGTMSVPMDVARDALRGFPATTLVKGWIPAPFAHLPEQRWAFVHIDVDLYEPTLAALEYFVPRLASGGVIINDDHGSPVFPGGGQAWDEYFTERNRPFVALATGQAVYVAP